MKSLSILAGAIGGVLRAWVMSLLWVWFITPIFGLPSPSLFALYGLGLFVALIVPSFPEHLQQDTPERMALRSAYHIILPLVTVGIGFLVHAMEVGAR